MLCLTKQEEFELCIRMSRACGVLWGWYIPEEESGFGGRTQRISVPGAMVTVGEREVGALANLNVLFLDPVMVTQQF